jgi:hypothetical protein
VVSECHIEMRVLTLVFEIETSTTAETKEIATERVFLLLGDDQRRLLALNHLITIITRMV